MKKINIQRDLESRKNIAQTILPAREFETAVEPVKEEKDAESEVVQGDADDTVAASGEKSKKRKRSSAGNIQAVPV